MRWHRKKRAILISSRREWVPASSVQSISTDVPSRHELRIGASAAERADARVRAWAARTPAELGSLSDALIAASAMIHGLTVVTRNTPDFEPMGVAVLNPWLAPGG
jgi:hypothetical protein